MRRYSPDAARVASQGFPVLTATPFLWDSTYDTGETEFRIVLNR